MSRSPRDPVSSWSLHPWRIWRPRRRRQEKITTMKQPIRLLLVDDHSLFRESLSRLLETESEFRIAATCATVEEALAALDRHVIDVVLLDYDLGDQQGSVFLDEAKRRGFAGRILMVTAGMSDGGTLRAFESGSAGVFLKHSPPSQ